MLYSFCRFICLVILKLFFKLEVKGREAFPQKGPFILASNHVSNLDPVVVGVGCPRTLNYLAKEELFKNKAFGIFLKNINVIALKRSSGDLRVMRQALEILKNKPLAIFPQGTRTESFDTFKEGVGFLYKRSKAPIIAARVYGSNRVLAKGAKFPKFGKIKVVYAKVEGLNSEDSRETIAAKVVETIKKL
jgi:1-acyl-sn-glycerol-3-phosphate acyltransferase